MKFTCSILLFLLPVIACAQSDFPVLNAGTVKINGEVTIPKVIKKDSVWLSLTVPLPFTGGVKTYKTLLDSNGKFALEVNTEISRTRCAISTDIDMDNQVTVFLKNGRENKISLHCSDEGAINNVVISDNPGFTEEDLLQDLKKYVEALSYRSNKPREPLYDKPFSVFIHHANNVIQDRRSLLDKPPFISEKMKEVLFKDYSLSLYYAHVFDYREEMIRNYSNTNNGKLPDSSVIQQPVREDYSFLKNLDLNNQLNLYCYSFQPFTLELLRNNALNIPRIQETPIREWLKNVKNILRPLIGFDQGMYYDMLVSNAYAMQFEVELKPLTPKQIANIKNYYKGSDVEKLLLRRNGDVTQVASTKGALVVNNTPAVAPEALMDAIISRYKGKTVIVDFWATWCTPCLEAMKTSRDLKKQFHHKDVVFIYITNPTSPKKLWDGYIQGIGGEQYYLTAKEYSYVSESFHIKGIPTYLMYDKNGVLKHQFTAYPGNEVMQKQIKALTEGDLISDSKP